MSDSGDKQQPEVSSAPEENNVEASPTASATEPADPPKDQNETVTTNEPPSQQPEDEPSPPAVPAPTNDDTAEPAVEAPAPEGQTGDAQTVAEAPASEIPTVEAPADAAPAAEQLSEAPVEAPVEAPAEPPQTAGAAPLVESIADEPSSSKKLTVTAKETPVEPETLPTSMVTHVVSQPQNESTDVPPQDAAPQEAAVEEAAPVILAAEAASEALKKAAEKGPVMKKSTIIRAEGAPDVDGSSNTLFILDLMRQQREKLMRKKKDEMINEMALKMKRQKEDAKRKGATTYSYSYGGFLGVEKLTKSSGGPVSPKPSPRVQRKALVIDEVVAVPSDAKSRAMFEGP